jgi:preprotein translocase subunit SecE
MNKLFTYLKESRAELGKVVWPSRKEARDHTILVIVVSVGVALFLGALDYLLEQGVITFIIK